MRRRHTAPFRPVAKWGPSAAVAVCRRFSYRRAPIDGGTIAAQSSGVAPLALIVDDDPDFRNVLCELLEDEGFRTTAAANGTEALEVLDSVTPDVILIDLIMPVMNGWSLFAHIDARPELNAVPIVFLSAVPQMAPAGGSLILKKPLDLPALLTLLDALRPAPTSGEMRIQASPRTAPDYRLVTSRRK